MFIEGKWYTEPEIICLIKQLKNKIEELEAKQGKDCDCND